MAEYGIPYMGSKGAICNELIKIFPKADNFYDLFGGGFSVTHAMILRRPKDYKQFHFNELRPGICDLIKDAINGKYSYEDFKPKFISREEFFEKKESDPYIKICWSFGNNGKGYLFGKDIEQYKKSLHNAIIFNEFDDLAKSTLGLDRFKEGYTITQKRLLLSNRILMLHKKAVAQLQKLQQLERLQQLEQLQQLQRLEQLQQLNFYSSSYEKVPIKENSVIYCDPPYKGTAKYDGEFQYNSFYDWAANNKHPVFISEYNIDHKDLIMVWSVKKRSMLNKNKDFCTNKIEKVYANKAALAALNLFGYKNDDKPTNN